MQHLSRSLTGSGRGVLASLLLCAAIGIVHSAVAKSPQPAISADDRAFLDTLEERTFRFFWDSANPNKGLVPDRWPRRGPSSVAAIGFGLSAYCVGAERTYISREQAAERVLTTLRFLKDAAQSDDPVSSSGYRGFYYHFLDMQSGRREWNCELSSIDTALLMAGVLSCREYFDQDSAEEREIRDLADALYRRVEWSWMRPRPPLISMSWYPERGFGEHDYRGYNEAMLLYVLALGSPTYPIEPGAWDVYTSTYTWADFYGQLHINFEPLFGHQYSHVWIDFRGIQDRYTREKGIDYFENSRRATYSQRAYAIANPAGWRDYSADVWGLSACDGPVDKVLFFNGRERQFHSYWARGASAERINDDGTVAPTATGGSIPFAPEITIPALRAMAARYGSALFSEYGFLDSFNPSFTFKDIQLTHGRLEDGIGWVDTDYLGIDQGPILLMAENYQSELVWQLMKRSPYVKRGLVRAGFSGGWLDAGR
jgi:hypothetical protein